MADVPAVNERPTTRAGRLLIRLDGAAHKRWFLPTLSVFPLSDYALPVLPNQMLLMGLSALHPRRWRMIALTFVVASALGAFLAATLFQIAGPWLRSTLGGLAPQREELSEVSDLITQYGAWGVAALALLPWTPRAAVVMCALVGIPPWTIAAAVLVSRPVPVMLLAYGGARAPLLLRRSRRLERVLLEVEAHRTHTARQDGGAGTGDK
ncbi:VTT domain-containing protein [Streptomyces sp. NPDC005963]|uniref:VTT domain-containing protein n=1 Tax=Streptomyces sp. NPDC005963 TaxID=3156721 RepID=UPI0033F89425